MSEHENTPDRENESLSEELTPEEQAELTRRTFLRRTAEVGAFALFGVPTLEAAVRKVAQRVAEIQSLDGMAREAAEYLAQSGFVAAWAAEAPDPCPPHCPPGMGAPYAGCPEPPDFTPLFSCPPAQNFSCPQHQEDWFTCSIHHFRCTPPEDFGCNPFHCGLPEEAGAGYLCQNMAAYTPLTCPVDKPQEVDCHANFTCTGEVACDGINVDVLCHEPARFRVNCEGMEPPVDCAETFACNTGPQGKGYECVGSISFECKNPEGAGGFQCGNDVGTEKFTCPPAVVDFICKPVVFVCGQHNTFNCDAGHIFRCGISPDGGVFLCLDSDKERNFMCDPGGHRCGEPGVGEYGVNQPGDFICIGVENGFQCQNIVAETNFSCEGTVDDFECLGEIGGFTAGCTAEAPFNGNEICKELGDDLGGIFYCDNRPNQDVFHCAAPGQQAGVFTCTSPNNYSNEPGE